MEKRLHNIATLHSGIYGKSDLDADVYYIQAKHFNKDHQFDFSTKPELVSDGKIKSHFLQHGDILIAAKGNDNFAVHYQGLYPAVASSTFIIIRIIDKGIVTPDYLTWFLNMTVTQNTLGNLARGSAVQSLTKSDIEQLKIIVPPIEEQQIIVKVDKLQKTESAITKQLQKLKEQTVENLLLTAIK